MTAKPPAWRTADEASRSSEGIRRRFVRWIRRVDVALGYSVWFRTLDRVVRWGLIAGILYLIWLNRKGPDSGDVDAAAVARADRPPTRARIEGPAPDPSVPDSDRAALSADSVELISREAVAEEAGAVLESWEGRFRRYQRAWQVLHSPNGLPLTERADAVRFMADEGFSLAGLDLAGWSLPGLTLTNGVEWFGIDGRGLDLRGARLEMADFREATLSGARMTDGEMVGALFVGSDLKRAGLVRINLAHSDLTETDLSGADATGARMMNAIMTRARFTDATLAGALMDSVLADDAVFESVRGAGARWRMASLRNTRWTDANLEDGKFERADLTGADFTGANLRGADLTGAVLSGALLRGADLTDADLEGATFDLADFAGATLTGADLSGARLWPSKNLSLEQITGCVMDGLTELPPRVKDAYDRLEFEVISPEETVGAPAPEIGSTNTTGGPVR